MNRSRVRPSDRVIVVATLAVVGLFAACTSSNENCDVTDTCPNTAPTASITSPANGSMFDEFVAVAFAGSGSDADDGSLTGASLVWTSDLDGPIGTGVSFNKADLSVGVHTITLTATDSEGATGTASVQVTIVLVPNDPPVPTITAPLTGGSAAPGENVSFAGNATDTEDGSITGAALVWTSNLDGTIGTDVAFSTTTLSGGTHVITLTATDSRGATGTDAISFTITGGGTPVVAITAPVNQGSGAPHTVFEAASVTFTGTGSDPEDGTLTGGSLVWTSNVDGQIGTGETFSTSALSDGMHTVTLTGTDSDTNEAKATRLVIVKPPSAAGFQIHIRLSEGVTLTPSQQTAVDDAVTKLQAAITGDLGDIGSFTRAAGTCAGATTPALDESLDDLIIYLEFVPIDGTGGTLGSAGPCLVRSGTALSALGGMRFDTADLDFIESFGVLGDVIVHEMMHVLGFGTFWESPVDLLEQQSDPTNPEHVPGMTDTHFTGAAALAEFAAIGGGSYTGGNIVPVENDTGTFGTGSLDGHWRESVFDEESMTPAVNAPGPNPVSSLTIESFADLGYTVDKSAADSYSQTFSIVLGPVSQVEIDLSGDMWRGRIDAIYPDGAIRRIR